MRLHSALTGLTIAILMSACSATTNLATLQPDSQLYVKEVTGNATAATQTLSTTSFGNYEFMAVGADSKPFYGILPLKFNGGYLTMDILIFAPGAFFNLREVFPFYQFDIDKKIIRYRKSEQDNWVEYQPSAMEQLRAKQWFERNPVTAVQQP